MSDDKEREETVIVNDAAPAAEPEIAVPQAGPPVNAAMSEGTGRIASVEEILRSAAEANKAAADHRFKKGKSGNPRGRPRKIERSFTPRQQRRDVLRIAESETTIRTAKSKKRVSIIEAIIRVTAAKALAGHGPSINRIMKWYSDAIEQHAKAHAEKFDHLEWTEVTAALKLDEMTKFWNDYLNNMRKLTRRT